MVRCDYQKSTKGASHAHITLIAQQSQRRIRQFQKRGGTGGMVCLHPAGYYSSVHFV